MQQKSGERVSDYLRRLEKALSKAVQKGGLSHAARNRARVEQLLRGAAPESDILILQLRLKESLSNPLTFMELLSGIRVEEDHKMTRRRLTTGTHVVRTAEENEAHSNEVATLRSQVKALEAKVQQLSVKERPLVLHADSEVQSLKEQVASLQLLNQLSSKLSKRQKITLKDSNQSNPLNLGKAITLQTSRVYFAVVVVRMATQPKTAMALTTLQKSLAN